MEHYSRNKLWGTTSQVQFVHADFAVHSNYLKEMTIKQMDEIQEDRVEACWRWGFCDIVMVAESLRTEMLTLART